MTTNLLKNIKSIEIYTKQLARDVLAGVYRSAFKGRGIEFEDVREYYPGDEIRDIDWNITARMNHPYVKTFREERELTVHLVVDVSASCRFGSQETIKNQIIAEIGAVIAFSAIKNNDKLGLILFSKEVEKYLPPKKDQRHILRIIRDLLTFKPKKPGTNIGKALDFLGSLEAKPGVCFLISDFISEDFLPQARLISKRHDLIAICITNPAEVELPALELASMQDFESGMLDLIDTSDPMLRAQFKQLAEKRIASTKQMLEKIGVGFIDVRTNLPYMTPLRNFFHLKGRKNR
jgi:uncharacterized protein (DUF58 family)